MVRFFLSTALTLALALSALAQQPARPRDSDDVAKLREQVRDLEAQLKQSAPKKEEKGEKKPEPQGPPMGGNFGGGGGSPFGGGAFGGFGLGAGGPMPGGGGASMGGRSGIMDFTKLPGFEKLSPDEQKMLTKLIEKMRTPTPPAGSGSNSVEARLDRLEKAIGELTNSMRGAGGAGGRGGR